jgi:hypothetical protein
MSDENTASQSAADEAVEQKAPVRIPYMSHQYEGFPYFARVDSRGMYKAPAFYVEADKADEFDQQVASVGAQLDEQKATLDEQIAALKAQLDELEQARANLVRGAMEAVRSINPDVMGARRYANTLPSLEEHEIEGAGGFQVDPDTGEPVNDDPDGEQDDGKDAAV